LFVSLLSFTLPHPFVSSGTGIGSGGVGGDLGGGTVVICSRKIVTIYI
jgi:hypothetical protein